MVMAAGQCHGVSVEYFAELRFCIMFCLIFCIMFCMIFCIMFCVMLAIQQPLRALRSPALPAPPARNQGHTNTSTPHRVVLGVTSHDNRHMQDQGVSSLSDVLLLILATRTVMAYLSKIEAIKYDFCLRLFLYHSY